MTCISCIVEYNGPGPLVRSLIHREATLKQFEILSAHARVKCVENWK